MRFGDDQLRVHSYRGQKCCQRQAHHGRGYDGSMKILRIDKVWDVAGGWLQRRRQ